MYRGLVFYPTSNIMQYFFFILTLLPYHTLSGERNEVKKEEEEKVRNSNLPNALKHLI